MRHFLFPVDGADLVQSLDGGRQAAVNTEDLRVKQTHARQPGQTQPSSLADGRSAHFAVDDGGERQIVEDLGAVPPHRDRAVLPQTLVVEAVHLRDLSGLVIPADQRDSVWITHLQGSREPH